MAARRRCRPADGQGPTRPRLHLHHGKVPAPPPRGRRPGPGCVQQDPQPRAWTNGVNPRTRRTALFAIAAIAIAASANALAHSYAGLYAWALHHRLTGWQAVSWPAEIDVFLAVGELALYVAYLDGWPARQRVWPWTTTPVGLLVLRMNRQYATARPDPSTIACGHQLPATPEHANGLRPSWRSRAAGPVAPAGHDLAQQPATRSDVTDRFADVSPLAIDDSLLLKDAAFIYETAAARGERLTQRTLARTLRGQGHRFPNQSLRGIALAVGLGHPTGQLPADGG